MRLFPVVLATLPLGFACAAPSKATPPERQKVTTRDRESEREQDEKLKAPPPSYGNKVVRDGRERPEAQARDEVDECRVPEAKGVADGPTETECAPAPTTTVY
jgi:hypothetical protein